MTRRRHGFLSLTALVSFSALSAPVGAQNRGARVEQFSPSGVVKTVRQVRARFSTDMIPLGDPSISDPFEIACGPGGEGRWADSRNWLYDFEENLTAGILCSFTLRENLTDLEGRPLGGQRTFQFSTGGPSVVVSRPWDGSEGIDENQVFVLQLDGQPTDDSVLRHVYFSVDGLLERIPARIVNGPEREEIIQEVYRYYDRVPDHLLLLQAQRTFPYQARVRLVWAKEVETPGGVANRSDQILNFRTRPDFTARFHCQRENAQSACLPITQMRVTFTAPLAWEAARRIEIKDGTRSWRPNDSSEEWIRSLVFDGPFPEKELYWVHLPSDLRDDADRPLSNADRFPLEVRTDQYPPLVKFSAPFGILEAADPVLPVTVRNLEASLGVATASIQPSPRMTGRMERFSADQLGRILGWLKALDSRGYDDRETSIFAQASGPADPTRFTLPKPNGDNAFEVMGIPLEKPGFYLLEIESLRLGESLLGKSSPMYVPTAALVTDLSVHFKWGIESSMAWVTRLGTGKPAGGTQVRVWDCAQRVLAEGTADQDGIVRFNDLPPKGEAPSCSWESYSYGLFVSAAADGDFTFTHTSWDRGIEPWRFQIPTEWDDSLLKVHSVLDRMLFRAGETAHMKHFLRRRSNDGFARIPPAEAPDKLVVSHQGSDQQYELPLKWDEKGISETRWLIPREARLGSYSIELASDSESPWQGQRWSSGSFRVEEFRVPLMRGTLRAPTQHLIRPSEVKLDLTVRYLSGGGAGGLPVRVRHQVEEYPWVSVEDYEAFTFTNGPVEEGLQRAGAETPAAAGALEGRELTLDESGSATVTVQDLSPVATPMRLRTEVEFRDPNGEVQTVSNTTPMWPSELLVGIKQDSWHASADALKFQVVVLDLEHAPVAGREVTVELFERRSYSHRKRLIGGFYAYEHRTEVKKNATLCQGKTNSRGLLLCEAQTALSGSAIVQAKATDSEGRDSPVNTSVWIAGDGRWWFMALDHDRMDVLPERPRYEPGEQATLQVRMPFERATALVTAEREGVSDAWVVELDGREPLIEVPVTRAYAPNVYISVLAVRGRVAAPAATAIVDLARPSYKLGIANLQVGWKEHELDVRVSTDRRVYRVRETAEVGIEVRGPNGGAPPPGSEVAVAAVDEGLLELMPNTSWDLLESMMGQRSYGVTTATAQMHVVGKRHFGLKALPQGGGGGRQSTREIFDTLLLWEGRVALDEAGRATVRVPLNDSLTSFRIAAVASSNSDLFGTGSTTIRSTQDLMILPGLPPVVRQGDKLRAGFTVRNASERELRVQVKGRATPLKAGFGPEQLVLRPGTSRELGWEVTIPGNAGPALEYQLEVMADSGETDVIKISQRVEPALEARTLQATLQQVTQPLTVPLDPPARALPGKGGVRLSFRSSLVGGLDTVKQYMRTYPYSCLEQKVSQTVVVGDLEAWDNLMERLPSYLDSSGFLKYFPAMRWGSPVLSAYVLAVAHERNWQVPESTREQVLEALEQFVEGKLARPSPLSAADLVLRKLTALEALSRYGRVTRQLVSTIPVQPNLWPTSSVIDWFNVLRRQQDLSDRAMRLRNAEQILLSRLHFEGTVMGFSTEARDRLWWMMVSSDGNAARLILSALESGGWEEDLPRMMEGALKRRRVGRWDLTTSNAWGALAVEKFARRFESDPVTGQTRAAYGGGNQRVDWLAQPRGGELDFPWRRRIAPLRIRHLGEGAPWVTIESRAAIPIEEPVARGFRVEKSIHPVLQRQTGRWSVGDVARIELRFVSQATMTWVVVDDPIPAGSSILGSGLGGDSALLSRDDTEPRWWNPTFEERSFEGFRAYYDYLPKGSWIVRYTVRFNNAGDFQIPPTRVEAMYHPEMHGERPNPEMSIQP